MLFKPPAKFESKEEMHKRMGVPTFVVRIGSMRSPGMSHAQCVQLQADQATKGRSVEIIYDPQGF